MLNHILNVEDHQAYPWITITETLNWVMHIINVKNKANKTLGFINRNLHSCAQRIKAQAYRPRLCSKEPFWAPKHFSWGAQPSKLVARSNYLIDYLRSTTQQDLHSFISLSLSLSLSLYKALLLLLWSLSNWLVQEKTRNPSIFHAILQKDKKNGNAADVSQV